MKTHQKIDSWGTFFWKKSWWAILIVIGIFMLFYENYPPARPESIEAPHVWEWFERMFAYITFLVALLLWWGQKHAEWIDYLPNRLTVSFFFDGQEVMRCEKAILSNESDIRALSQTIGAQMVNKVRHKDDPESKVEQLNFIPAKVEIDPFKLDKKNKFLHYSARIYLTELPERLKEIVKDGKVLVWGPDFDKKPEIKPRS